MGRIDLERLSKEELIELVRNYPPLALRADL